MNIFKDLVKITIVLLCILFIPSINYAQEIVKGTVIDKNTVLCKEPKSSSQSLDFLGFGEEVFIEENQGKWYRVSTSDGMFGWVHSECILVKDKNEKLIENGIVNIGTIEVRKEPNISSDIMGRVGFATKVAVLEKKGDWYQLGMGDEVIGWVPSEYIITTPVYKKAKIMSEKGAVYEKPSKDSKLIKELDKNYIVKIDDYEDGYFHIMWGKKGEGFIYANEVKLIHEDFFYEAFAKKEVKEKVKEKAVNTFKEIIENATYLGGDYAATAYDLSIASCGKAVGSKYRGFTRTGYNLNGKSWKEAMVVAVDSRKIPLGSKILVLFDEGDWRAKYNGIYLAADTGGGVKGKTIDIYLGDIGNKQMKEVRDFGKTYNVKVYLLN
ncbi:SH3 domain-containing protein [Crassaminicella indica]|uniref:SH3 domain-containing protein n=1 Tax=Crassaminicella indica TaxID=2855394 RepID=A0ABX8RDC5_9CLOT|nr:SH3 domain-containing protein [Crassaminicella indica]QXM07084.1 SH3 domain-containing protein [Crassaminicella indica]